jgi:uncharacterized CHY-type Zn-finger protein
MLLKEPQSMDELVYFTRRDIGAGKARCWVFKEKCPKCKNAFMGKPVVKGKVKVRAKEYVCPSCEYLVEKLAYEESLTANVHYVCPACSFSGYAQVSFKRKRIDGILALQVACEKCKGKINITKKMKVKGGVGVADEDDE